ncbi:MAG: adenine deaminase, partial [Deltaproteobacteria bacterium]
VVVSESKVIARLRLEIAGLMTQRPVEDLLRDIDAIKKGIEYIGSNVKKPFVVLSFLALPVIPELRITDKGLVDVNNFKLTSLFLK